MRCRDIEKYTETIIEVERVIERVLETDRDRNRDKGRDKDGVRKRQR